MKLFDLYILKNILQSVLVVLFIFLALLGFIEFIAQADDIGIGSYGLNQAIQYSLLKLPSAIFQLMPIIILIGSLLALGDMSKNSELLVLLTSGVSLQRMCVSIFFSGIVLCFFTASIGEYISPKMERYADQYRTINKYQYSRLGDTGGIWLREGDKIIHINLLKENKSFGNVSIYQLAGHNKLSKISRASSAGIDDYNQWILSNLSETVFDSDGITDDYSRYKIEKTKLNRDLVNLTIVKSEDLNIVELYRFINYLDSNDLDSSPYRMVFHSRIASLLAIPIMCLLALPFSLGFLRKKGIGFRIMLGVMIGLFYFLLQRTLAESAVFYNFEPFLVGWSPILLLIIFVFSLFKVIKQYN